ncbi:MAG TPA: hypothetical protein VNC63_15050 [Propionibacteriaceae bacterium]|jgi:hypothetical protein|nr:hypothetical protein [Propionibacteriaceae bacterium]
MSALYRGGVALLGVLSVIGLSTALFTDGQHPPMFITIIGAVLDLIGIVLAVLAWRGRPAAAIGLSVVRVLSALLAVPAFYVGGVPGPIMAVAGTFIVLTIVGVVLMLAGMRRPAPVSA